jgi:glutamate-1-semialdehyde 2,1-aminomutase
MAAGLATLRAMGAGPHAALDAATRDLSERLLDAARRRGFPLSAPRLASLLWIAPQEDFAPRDASPMSKESVDRFARLHRALLAEGVFLPPSAYEVCFLSTAHGAEALDEIVAAFERALARIA